MVRQDKLTAQAQQHCMSTLWSAAGQGYELLCLLSLIASLMWSVSSAAESAPLGILATGEARPALTAAESSVRISK